ncbi:TraR/DksA C4-type zinc finger protein [Patescibacteria group bacterium]|nr:TraR/DksA C4-type zinc finger protein [Patescibacteria group bacterium]
MDSNTINQFKEKLLKQKQQITKQLEGITHESKFDKDKIQAKWEERGDKEEDNAVEVAEYQDNISLERNLEINLEKIDSALGKIEDGTYGVCDSCGNKIDDARLIAYPEATLCMTCKSKKRF